MTNFEETKLASYNDKQAKIAKEIEEYGSIFRKLSYLVQGLALTYKTDCFNFVDNMLQMSFRENIHEILVNCKEYFRLGTEYGKVNLPSDSETHNVDRFVMYAMNTLQTQEQLEAEFDVNGCAEFVFGVAATWRMYN